MPDSEIPSWVKTAVWALGIGLGITGALSSMLYRNLIEHYDSEIELARSERTANRAVIEGVATELARVGKHTEEHEKVASREIDRINRIEQQCQDVRNKASARPDPFTSAEGRALEQRLDARIDALEIKAVFIDTLKEQIKALLEDNIYYRRQLLPMIEDIRNIQQHKQ
jgi:hypothetical protein